MKVALFTDSDAFAGTEQHIWTLAQSLAAEGVDVMIASPPASPLEHRAIGVGLSVVPIVRRRGLNLRAVRLLRRLIKQGEIDVIHAHNGRSCLQAAIAVWTSGAGACVMTQHFMEPHRMSRRGPARWLSNWAHRVVGERVKRFIAVSHAAARAMKMRGDTPVEKIVTIPSGVSTVDPATLTAAVDVRKALGIASSTPLVVCVARLEPEKDVSCLISAMATVAARCPGAQCIIAGDGSERPTLERQIDRLNLRGRVLLLGFRPDAPSLINASDIFVLPSRVESFGLVAAEAMALGKPVIATRSGGPEEVVDDGVTGRLVAVGSQVAIADAILAMIEDADAARFMGARGYERFVAMFGVRRMALATKAVYQAAIGQT